MPVMNQAQFRDWIRIKLGKMPKAQATNIRNGTQEQLYPDAVAGDPCPNDPFPSNAQINQSLQDAIDEVNLMALPNLSYAPRSIEVQGLDDSTATGAMQIPLSYGTVGQEYPSNIDRINQAWIEYSGSMYPLDITTLDQYVKENPVWFSTVVSSNIPYKLWISGYHAWIYPATTYDFTLWYVAYEGLRYPVNDQDYIGGLAGDEYSVLGWIAARNCAGMAPRNEDLTQKYQQLSMQSEKMLSRLAANVGSRAGNSYQPMLTPSYDYRWPNSYRRRG